MSAKITWSGLSDTRALHREEISTESSSEINQRESVISHLKIY